MLCLVIWTLFYFCTIFFLIQYSEETVPPDVNALSVLFRPNPVCVFQAEEDLRQNKACHVHAVDQTVHTDEEKAIREVVDSVLWQMAADRKSTALKQLQGHMWRAAYVTGKIKGE